MLAIQRNQTNNFNYKQNKGKSILAKHKNNAAFGALYYSHTTMGDGPRIPLVKRFVALANNLKDAGKIEFHQFKFFHPVNNEGAIVAKGETAKDAGKLESRLQKVLNIIGVSNKREEKNPCCFESARNRYSNLEEKTYELNMFKKKDITPKVAAVFDRAMNELEKPFNKKA